MFLNIGVVGVRGGRIIFTGGAGGRGGQRASSAEACGLSGMLQAHELGREMVESKAVWCRDIPV